MPAYESPQLQSAIRAGQAPLWSDYLKTAGIGTTDLLAAVPAGTRYAAELTDTDLGESIASSSQYLQDVVHGWGEDLEAGLSEPARENLLAEFGSEAFWKHPFSSIALKATRTSPSMAATVAGTMLTGGGAPALAALAGIQGGLSATQTVDEMYRAIDSQSDADLRVNSKLYNQFRQDGLSEREARRQLNQVNIGAKPAVLFAVGAATSLFGPEAQVLRGLGAKGLGAAYSGGIVRRTGKAMGAGAVSEAIETGAESLASEQGAVDVGFQSSINPYRVAAATAEGATLGALFGTVGGIRRPTNNANPRPNPNNPSGAAVAAAGAAVPAPGPVSMPAKGSNTQAAPPIVPGRTGHTAATSGAATIPNKTPNQKKPKVVTAPTVPLTNTPQVTAPAPVAPQGPLQGTERDPGGLVADQTQVAALNAQTAPTGPVAPPTPTPVPVAPVQAVSTTPAPVQETTAPAPVQQAAPTGPASTPSQTAPSLTVQPPGAGFGAGTAAVPVTQAVPTEEATPSAFGGVAQPVVAPTVQPIVQPTAPVVAEPVITPVAPVTPKTPKAPKVTGDKNAQRVAARTRDAQIAQDFLNARPAEPVVPTTLPEVDAFVAGLKNTLEQVSALGVKFRRRVSGEKMPASIVWLRELETAYNKLKSGKLGAKATNKVISEFITREIQIKAGDVKEVKATRKGEGTTAMAVPQGNVETIAAGPQQAATEEEAARRESEEVSLEEGVPEATTGEEAAPDVGVSEEVTETVSEEGEVSHEKAEVKEVTEKPRAGQVSKDDVETKVGGARAGPVKLADRTEKRKIVKKGGEVEEVEGTEAADEGRSRKDLFAQYNAQLAAEAAAKAGAKPEPAPEDKPKKLSEVSREFVEEYNKKNRYGPISRKGLVVARKMPDGTIKYGEPGQIHSDLVDAREDYTPSEIAGSDMGFAEPGGPFMTRAETIEVIEGRKSLPLKVAETKPAAKVDEIKAKAADKKAAQEAKLPPKVKRKKLVSKPAPKPSGKAALADEMEKIEREPTDGQIAADNASKAHTRIGGLPISLTVAANTERNILTAAGRRITWLYKYAYGHILGTKAPDGKPIDIFLGPEAYPNNPNLKNLPVVVIDQVDPDTKAPDEPKVMFGFKQVSDPKLGTGAVEAYEGSYPRGKERRGDVTIMSLDEFKAWLKTKSDAEPAGAPVSDVDVAVEEAVTGPDVEAKLSDYEIGKPRPVSTYPRGSIEYRTERYRENAEGTEAVAAAFASRSGKLSEFLDTGADIMRALDFVSPLSRALYPRLAKRIKAIAGDVQVYVVSDEVFINQLHKDPNTGAFYSMGGDFIIVRESEALLDEVNFAAIILHESVHAAFMKAAYSNPKMLAKLEVILAEARAAQQHVAPNQYFYGLHDIDEMMAEAFSNLAFQQYLLDVRPSKQLIKDLGLDGKYKSLWDVVVRLIGMVLGTPRPHDTLLGAVMKMTARLELGADSLKGPASDEVMYNWYKHDDALQAGVTFGPDASFRIPERLNKRLPPQVRQAPQQQQQGSPWALRARTTDQIVQAAKGFGKEFYNHLRRAADTIERIRVSADRYLNESMPIIRELHALERKYKGTGQWQAFTDLVMDETSVGVFADRPLPQKHLGKQTLRGIYPKARHAELNTRWQALPQDLKDARLKAMNFFTEQQNLEKIGIIRNTLKVVGYPDPDLAQRLFDGDETDVDIALLGRTYDHIKDASELAKIKGPYFPQMRRGEHVVRALYRITAPTNALRQIDDNTWEFGGPGINAKQARKQAAAFAAAQDHMKPTVSSVWVDTNTGERYFNLGQPNEVRVRPQDADAEQRFRVSIQNRFVEFFESKREAFQVAEELKNNPDVESVQDVVPRRFQTGDRQADMLSHQMQTLADSLERRPGFQSLSPNQQNQVVQAFNTASLRLLSQTRIQTKRLPRTNVLGASRDLTRNTLEYAQSVSGYLARLDHQDELNTSMKEARAEADSSNDYGKGYGQGAIMNEMEHRVARSTAFEERGKLNEWINRSLAVSFADKLISPAYNMLNALQVTMMSYPALAARFGPGRAAIMLFRVYRDIGTGQALKSGLVASKRALREGPSAQFPNIIDDIKANLKSKQELAMLDYIIERGGIDPDAGIEVSNMIETRTGMIGGLDQGINYLQTFGRQMPRSIEAINRTVTAIAAYRLEMSRSGDQEASTRFAQETVNMTQGLYSHSNAAPIFNHPLGKMSFQFKKYGQLVYGLIGHNVGKAIRNAEPGDRAEAVKTLAYMAATHVVMAGALGLPTEPFKWLIIGARQAGITELTWADVENYEREILASAFGSQLGEIAARGVSRALPEGFAFDMSSRVGLQDLFTFGEPRSDDAQDVKSYLFDLVGGAPAGLVLDWSAGVQAVMNGEWGRAAEKLTPIKMVADAIKSYRQTSEGKKTAAGYVSMTPYGIGEAAIRTLGFTPAREAETSEARNYFYSATKRASAERNSLMQDWYQAAPNQRARMWGQVEAFNRGKAKDERLTRSELDKYTKRRRTEEKSGLVKSGFRVTRREQNQYKKLQGTYNISP